ncbi:MAG: S1C family serine protease [Candidatus Dormibacter sp.]|uniref:S1C family serine protease n=1 Tax=Candidatus Dormibacter sp. TaxID=2973982 RepID=UPI000DB1B909|nr:MAG: serine protease [Candidatus Dormibacteraeota bacterium]
MSSGGAWVPPPGSGGGDWRPDGEGSTWPPYQPVAANAPTQRRTRRKWAALVAGIYGLAFLAAGVVAGIGLSGGVLPGLTAGSASGVHIQPQLPRPIGPGTAGRGPAGSGSQGSAGGGSTSQVLNPQAVAAKVDPAVVDINTVLTSAGGRSGAAAGTGMLVTSSGEVLTNNHVIQGATSIRVTVPSQSRTYTATVMGEDPTADVALLKLQSASGLSTVGLADSSTVSVGQQVVAIGNALGQGGTPTATQGAITALNQSITVTDDNGQDRQLSGLLESDASISPGDSGGPLVNASGQVLGMITAGSVQGRGQQASTDGYAVPTNTAVSVIHQIESGNASSTVIIGVPGYLGVFVQNLDASSSARLGVSSGVLVTDVVPGSAAAKARLGPDAVITAIDGTAVNSVDALGQALHGHKPGQQVRVDWTDRQGSHSQSVTLDSGPPA